MMHFIKNIFLSLILVLIFFGTTSTFAGNGIANLPNTAACRNYLAYAQRGYGGNNIPELYRLKNLCFNGSRNNPIIKREYRDCPRGYSRSNYGGTWYCGSSRPIACDAMATAARALNGLYICHPSNMHGKKKTIRRTRQTTKFDPFADD